jgi:curved DNA-binding protein CbpA
LLDKAKTRTIVAGSLSDSLTDEIKKSYYSLAKKYHPDRYHQSKSDDLKSALDVIFSTLAQAYDTLKVPATRGSYDAKVFRLETPAGASPDKPAPPASPSAAPHQKLAELNYRQGRGQYDQQDYWSATQAFASRCAWSEWHVIVIGSRWRFQRMAKWRRRRNTFKAIDGAVQCGLLHWPGSALQRSGNAKAGGKSIKAGTPGESWEQGCPGSFGQSARCEHEKRFRAGYLEGLVQKKIEQVCKPNPVPSSLFG